MADAAHLQQQLLWGAVTVGAVVWLKVRLWSKCKNDFWLKTKLGKTATLPHAHTQVRHSMHRVSKRVRGQHAHDMRCVHCSLHNRTRTC